MDKFFVYLIETGIVLSLGYLGYVFFFRKETYFNFIRFYLLSIVVLAVLVPLIHVNINMDQKTPLAKGVNQINGFKDYYEQLVNWTNVEYVYEEGQTSRNYRDDKSNHFSKQSLSSVQVIVLIIYFTGVVFFVLRFIYLVFWLSNYSKKNKTEYLDSIRLVQLQEDVPSFSYFNRVFINKSILTEKEFEQVFAHEKVHAQQKHSIDLVLAQVIAIFQWFNPLAWRLNKSMKIVHEYIADRKVVEQGYGLFDYQALLLSQLAGIRSVELINNFNLLSIKKRIAMMNKLKSGFLSKLKAVIALPLLLTMFFLFSDMTFSGSKNGTASFVEANDEKVEGLKLPKSSYYKEVEMSDRILKLSYDGKEVHIGNSVCVLADLKQAIIKELDQIENKDNYLTIALAIDVRVKATELESLFLTLRELELLKIAYLVEPSDIKSKDKTYAFFQMLPPLDATIVDEEVFEAKGIELFIFTEKTSIDFMKEKIRKMITSNQKYVMKFNCSGSSSYQEYITYSAAVFDVFVKVRNEYTLKTFNVAYDELPDDRQREIRKKFPIHLTKEIVKD